jgi:large conductance mechanosensitive channel
MNFLKEFRDFAVKGNMLDMAVGIVIGAAFTTIVSSMVDDIIMPPIGLVLGGVDFSDLFVKLRDGTPPGPYATLQAARDAGAVTWNIGNFINALVKFTIVAFALFMVVKAVNNIRRLAEKEKKQEAAAPAVPPREVVLLEEIRDLLAGRAQPRP